MYIKKTYIIKIQSWNLIYDNRLLAVSFQMIQKKQRSLTGSFSQKWARFMLKFFQPEPGSGSFAEILGQCQYYHKCANPPEGMQY